MASTKTELMDVLYSTLKELDKVSSGSDPDYLKSENKLLSYFYTPNSNLSNVISELESTIETYKDKKKDSHYNNTIGRLMEQIAFLSFKSIEGVSAVSSFQSSGPQYDLIVTGDTPQWLSLCSLMRINHENRDIIIEAKATQAKVNDQQFARLCSLMQMNLKNTAGLGVFFSLNGASGFPTNKRIKGLQAARLRQVMFMLSEKKPIVVFDKNDIISLDKPGSLIKIIIQKIREIDQLSGLNIPPDIEKPVYCDLPAHLTNI